MGFTTFPSHATRGAVVAPRPIEERHWPIHFANDDGTVGACAYPVNYDELYNLKGRLLTLVDATFQDPEQRKAFKDMVWNTLREWMDNLAQQEATPAQQTEGAR